MVILGAFILPHGALPLNPTRLPYPESSLIQKSCFQIAYDIEQLKPDIIFMTTPHGISLENSYGLYLNKEAEGTAEWLGEWKDYKAKIKIATTESKEILNLLQSKSILSEGIVAYSEDMPLPLRWGEVIPMWFAQQPYLNSYLKPSEFPEVVLMTMPRKRINYPDLMVDDCIKIGNIISDYFTNVSNKKCVVLISGDQAHTHIFNPISYSNDEADIFDKAIEEWVKNPIEKEQLLLEASKIVTKYLSCGYTGIVLLNGIIQHLNNNKYKILGNVFCNLHPTYYGMMAAEFKITN